MEALDAHRFQFAFTVAYHYLFPQLTMGLALLIVIFKTMGLRGDDVANDAARFWTKIFAINFVFGVVTGIPMEFQFGTNWARFSEASGGVIGQTLAMEGVFAFFLESAFLYAMLFGEDRLGPKLHWLAAFFVFLGSWVSGWFIVSTNAFMQHPVGYEITPDGKIVLADFFEFITNPWALIEYPHVMVGSCITATFVVCGIGAFYLLSGRHQEHARKFLRVGVPVGIFAALFAAYPTGDSQARIAAEHQGPGFAAFEGLFETTEGAPLALIGQPNMETLTLDNPILLPDFLSFLTYRRLDAEVKGLTDYDRSEWPQNIPLLYYAYHVMIGLGTIFIGIMVISTFLLFRKKLFTARPWLWVVMLATPFPYIANTAGWMTAELSRQPWIIHGLMKTADGYSKNVSGGNVMFTLLGFMGLYALLSMLFFFLVTRIIGKGPEGPGEAASTASGGSEPTLQPEEAE